MRLYFSGNKFTIITWILLLFIILCYSVGINALIALSFCTPHVVPSAFTSGYNHISFKITERDKFDVFFSTICIHFYYLQIG